MNSSDSEDSITVSPSQKQYYSVSDIGFSEDANPRFRRTMEDAHVIQDSFGEDETQGFFAIYDGHGGRSAVEYTEKKLHINLLDELKTKEPEDALKEAFLKTDREIGENKIESSGSTAVVALLRRKEKKLYIANCGDARAVISVDGKVARLSQDHKGTDEAEIKRITDLGGFVVLNRVNGVLAVTRSLGDFNMKEFVIPNPFITATEILETSKALLILACDGLWDVISDEDAINLIMNESSAQNMSEKLLRYALDNGSTDNISIMVIKL
jgi:protein phosphatase PTC1